MNRTTQFKLIITSSVIAVALLSGCGKQSFKFGKVDRQSQLSAPSDSTVTSDNTNSVVNAFGAAGAAESKLRIGDRTFVATSLVEIFGSGASSHTNPLIARNTDYYGGPCDPNALDCTNPADSQIPMITSSTTGRLGLLIRTCDRITQTDALVQYAIALAAGSSSAFPGLPEIANAYSLFYPAKQLDPSVQTALQSVVLTAKSNFGAAAPLEGWRFLFLTLCMSADWQIP